MIIIEIDNKGGHITCGFAKVRQSEIVLEYFSEIVNCRTCRKAAISFYATVNHLVKKNDKKYCK